MRNKESYFTIVKVSHHLLLAAQLINKNTTDHSICRECRSGLKDLAERCPDIQKGLDVVCGDAKILKVSLFSAIFAVLVAVTSALN